MMHKEATESAEHKRLVRVLETYADECGYTADGTDVLDIPEIPDVVQFNDAKEMLFVGDAKVSDGPDVPNTLKQIDGYFAAFLKAIQAGRSKGGIIAIAVSDANAVQPWQTSLDRLAVKHGLTYEDKDKSRVTFKVERLPDAWVIRSSKGTPEPK